jgi:hypothetical protein
MGKIEKLREVNATIKNILIDLETRIFVENMNTDDSKKIKKEELKVVELK